MKKIIVTGAAGFIGANFVLRLLEGDEFSKIIGVDNLNDYYDVRLKKFRLEQIEAAAARIVGNFFAETLRRKILSTKFFPSSSRLAS